MIRRRIHAWAIHIFSVFLGVVVITLDVSCDPGVTYYFDNRTDTAIDIYLGERHLGRIQPGADVDVGAANPQLLWPQRVHAYAEDGSLIFDHMFTRDEVEELDNRIVIE